MDGAQDSPGNAQKSKKGPKVYKIKLKKVAEINPEVLARFLKGQQSHDNAVLTAITALNVVIRMEPTLYACVRHWIVAWSTLQEISV